MFELEWLWVEDLYDDDDDDKDSDKNSADRCANVNL